MTASEKSAETFLGGEVIVRQPESGFRSGLDAVMLAAAVPARAGQIALELGAGAGTASLCLAARTGIAVTGLELDGALVLLANENAAANGRGETVRFVEGDVLSPPDVLKIGFDLVFANPPFHGPGSAPPDPARAQALMDKDGLTAWLAAGLKRTISGGIFTAIIRADRAGEALASLPETGVTLFPLWPRAELPAKRVILRVAKGSGAAFVLHPGLILHQKGGAYTAQAQAILRGGSALALDFPRL